MSKKRINIVLINFLLIVIVTFITYGNSLTNDFVGDDYITVVQNRLIRSWSNLALLFSKNYITQQNDIYRLPPSEWIGPEINYRPLRMITYFIDYTFWKLNPLGYHLSNVLYHMFCGILLYILFLLIGITRPISLMATLLFITHPVQFEAVNSITFRGDILYTFFYVASLILYIKSFSFNIISKKVLLYILSLLSFTFSLFSKEAAISLPFLLIIYDLHFNFNYNFKKTMKYFCSRYLSYFFVLAFYTLIYLFLQKVNISSSYSFFNNFFYTLGNLTHKSYGYLTFIIKELTFYLKAIILPFNLPLLVMDQLPFSLSNAVFSLFIFLIIFFIFSYLFFRFYKYEKYLTFSFLLFLITLLPLLNIPLFSAFLRLRTLMFTLVGYRYLYLPISGFCLGIAILIHKLEDFLIKNKPPLINKRGIFGIALIVLYIFLTIPNNILFRNTYIFGSELVNQWPKSKISRIAFATALMERGYIDKALMHYKEALKLNKNSPSIHYYIGYCNFIKDRLNEAEEEFKESLRLLPDGFYPNYYLGELYLKKEDYSLAIKYFKKAKELSPIDFPTIVNLGVAYFKNHFYQDAENEWLLALSLEPNSELVKKNLKALEGYTRKKYF